METDALNNTHMARRRWLAPLAFALAMVLVGCSAGSGPRDDASGTPTVVTSFPVLAELVERIGGEHVRVVNLIPVGVDEHSYYPPTTVARDLAEADLAIVNGYHLEESLLALVVENARPGVPVVSASAGLEALAGGHDHEDEEHEGEEHADEEHADEEHADEEHAAEVDDLVFAEGDPHLWLDAHNMVHYAENVRDALIRIDPAGADGYRDRAAAVVEELEALHEELAKTLEAIPPERRTLVVFHDAFQYFAAAYDFEIIASVAPANPNQVTSAAAIAEITDTVREAGVPTIYREPQYSGQSLDLIAAGSGTKVGVLYSIPSEQAPTYAAMMRANAQALVDGLAAAR